jgi:DNA-binding MarR family transcriptional regulator
MTERPQSRPFDRTRQKMAMSNAAKAAYQSAAYQPSGFASSAASVKSAEAAPVETPTVKPVYLEALHLVERLHRRLLDVIKDEFDRRSRDDVNAVQALLLYNIGDKELTAGELRTRGYYLGSNVSYNIKKMVELGYLHHARSRVDRRSVRISLTPKGKEVHKLVEDLYDRQVRTVEQIGGVSKDDFERMNRALLRLERFWTDQIRFRL